MENNRRSHMVKTVFLLLFTFALFSCKHEPVIKPEKTEITGGQGGKYNIAVFPVQGIKVVSGKVYIKYGAKAQAASLDLYDDSIATMVEPGYGPHAHFFSLKAGFYAIAARGHLSGHEVEGDTLIEIIENQALSSDLDVYMK